ncbi:ejaculatory bulb-specific protein 3 [Halyomorpha halys]|uniref:ejaculatory bulb-specific protein 3 n=1 Tax=Halyomorpha halys TaxID=286706 RepID=UPI0006D4EFB5|nr:ejaculatory bulb-specific protein 3-like [Halyomorpha halys]
MKVVIALLLFAAVAIAKPADMYTTKYDNIDIDEILNNERLYKKYIDCVMDKGTCTPDGKELRKNIPDAIATDCAKCSEHQKTGTDKVLNYMLKNKKADYDELEKKFDPKGEYRKRHNIKA